MTMILRWQELWFWLTTMTWLYDCLGLHTWSGCQHSATKIPSSSAGNWSLIHLRFIMLHSDVDKVENGIRCFSARLISVLRLSKKRRSSSLVCDATLLWSTATIYLLYRHPRSCCSGRDLTLQKQLESIKIRVWLSQSYLVTVCLVHNLFKGKKDEGQKERSEEKI